MSAVSRAIELPKHWAKRDEVASSSIMNGWGPPIWHTDEPVAALQRTGPEYGTLDAAVLAFIFVGRPT